MASNKTRKIERERVVKFNHTENRSLKLAWGRGEQIFWLFEESNS